MKARTMFDLSVWAIFLTLLIGACTMGTPEPFDACTTVTSLYHPKAKKTLYVTVCVQEVYHR